jgi:DNA polymerase III epsilon subunit-like protein
MFVVRGRPTVEQMMPHFLDFLGPRDTILLAHNAPFDLGFLAMALTRLGIAFPSHNIFDTLDMARRLYPAWPSHRLEHVATRQNVANSAAHRALSDARLVKEIFLAMLQHVPTVRTMADPGWLWPTLTFANASVCAIEPPAGFAVLTTTMTEKCAITIIYERATQPSRIRPVILQVL